MPRTSYLATLNLDALREYRGRETTGDPGNQARIGGKP
jgi:hypothetical protein